MCRVACVERNVQPELWSQSGPAWLLGIWLCVEPCYCKFITRTYTSATLWSGPQGTGCIEFFPPVDDKSTSKTAIISSRLLLLIVQEVLENLKRVLWKTELCVYCLEVLLMELDILNLCKGFTLILYNCDLCKQVDWFFFGTIFPKRLMEDLHKMPVVKWIIKGTIYLEISTNRLVAHMDHCTRENWTCFSALQIIAHLKTRWRLVGLWLWGMGLFCKLGGNGQTVTD